MKLNLAARTQAIVLLALVATSGALAGVVGDRLLSDRADSAAQFRGDRPRGTMPGPGAGAWRFEAQPTARYGERLAGSLELTPEQRAAIDTIMAEQQLRVRELNAEMQPRFRAIAEETRGRVEDLLTPEQRQRLGGLREERMRGMRPGMRELMREPRNGMRGDVMERRRELRDSIAQSRNGAAQPR
jgi:periplasmic protein CpxP/Spy